MQRLLGFEAVPWKGGNVRTLEQRLAALLEVSSYLSDEIRGEGLNVVDFTRLEVRYLSNGGEGRKKLRMHSV